MLKGIDEALAFQATALKLRTERQQLLAANIANADTPHYKAVDLNFAQALREATAPNQAPSTARLNVTATGHRLDNGTANLLYHVPNQPNIDGNTVDLDIERAKFADNAIRYEAAVKVLTQQIRGLLAAIQG